MPPYRCIAQGRAGLFDFNDPTPAVGTDGATFCVGVYFEITNGAGFHGCVIAHVDNNAKLVPNKGGDARFQAIVDDTQHVKWAELMPEGFQAVQGTLYLTGNSDPGLANAIAAGFHNVIQGGPAEVNQNAEGYGVQLDAGGAPQYPPTWFVGNPDTWYKFDPHTVQGTLAWTNDF